MPSGKVHEQVGMVALAAGGAALLFAPPLRDYAIDTRLSVFAGMAFGIILTPDIDLTTRTHEERRMMGIPIFGKMWIAFWASYSWWFNHRGISHVPILGTLTRLFWMARPVLGFAAIAWLMVRGGMIQVTWLIEPQAPTFIYLLPFFLGWTLQDAVHETADVLVSEHKQRLKDRKL